MMNGASTLEGYMPNIDATVVTRLLDAGATVVGKSVCEYFVSLAARTPAPPALFTTPTNTATLRVALLLVARHCWRLAKSTWLLVATKAAPSACLRLTAACTV